MNSHSFPGMDQCTGRSILSYCGRDAKINAWSCLPKLGRDQSHIDLPFALCMFPHRIGQTRHFFAWVVIGSLPSSGKDRDLCIRRDCEAFSRIPHGRMALLSECSPNQFGLLINFKFGSNNNTLHAKFSLQAWLRSFMLSQCSFIF